MQRAPHRHQQRIPAGMSEIIIHILETIEVHQHDNGSVLIDEHLFQAGSKQSSVGQAGKMIHAGQFEQLRLITPSLGYIA